MWLCLLQAHVSVSISQLHNMVYFRRRANVRLAFFSINVFCSHNMKRKSAWTLTQILNSSREVYNQAHSLHIPCTWHSITSFIITIVWLFSDYTRCQMAIQFMQKSSIVIFFTFFKTQNSHNRVQARMKWFYD